MSRSAGCEPHRGASGGEPAGRFDVLLVVHQDERLERRVGPARRAVQVSRDGASKAIMLGGGEVRFQKVYMLRR